MPTIPSRAKRWIRSGRATPFWKRGVFCIRLNAEPSGRKTQQIALGIDPGSKKEGFTVKSSSHTYLNLQADAVTWVKDHIEQRRMMRRGRRSRKTPCRPPRWNRSHGSLPPSTKARWQWKLRLAFWLRKMFPISLYVVEDIKAKTKGQPKWDKSFSPLEVGKNWFYGELRKLGDLTLRQGWDTKCLRDKLGLKKSGKKTADVFDAHCVDSWVLANDVVGGHMKPENTNLLCVVPLQLHRRQLHRLVPSKGGKRSLYGGTRSMGLKRGSLVKHLKWGIAYLGGSSNNRLSLHNLKTGERVTKSGKREDCDFLAHSSWRTYSVLT
jgi:hypothetical protein